VTDLSLLEKLQIAHVTTGQKMFKEASDAIEALQKRIAELERQLACSIVNGNDAREQCLEHVYALSEAAVRIAELEGDLARERSTTTCVPRGWR